jgi:RNA polymerase sigma-54 factor
MELRPNVFGQQRQTTTINAQVIQSIRLLQYSGDELRDFLIDQAERNPLLEVELPAPVSAKPLSGPRPFPVSGNGLGARDAPNLEEFCAATISLREHLLGQIALQIRCTRTARIAAEIVESLDDDGYFRRDPDDLADLLDLSPADVMDALAQVQSLDPAGIAARDLAECLRLQLRDRGRETCQMQVLLGHLPLVARYDIDQLARLCRTDKRLILAMLREIRSLDPRPGRQYECELARPALPDVLVERSPDGSLAVELNQAVMPRVLVDRQYMATVREAAHGTPQARFLTGCLKTANWLVHNLDRRAQTILRISTEIVRQQRAFFDDGRARLVPLALKDIAGPLGIHESTVCRATTNKYMLTPRGMMPLKSFFANAIGSTDGGDDLSTDLVREKILRLIEAETAQTVLPDDAICAILRRDGINIARRTVAKYREMMNIPIALTRRRQRAAEAMVGERKQYRSAS